MTVKILKFLSTNELRFENVKLKKVIELPCLLHSNCLPVLYSYVHSEPLVAPYSPFQVQFSSRQVYVGHENASEMLHLCDGS